MILDLYLHISSFLHVSKEAKQVDKVIEARCFCMNGPARSGRYFPLTENQPKRQFSDSVQDWKSNDAEAFQ